MGWRTLRLMFSPYRLALTRPPGQQSNRNTADEVEGASAGSGTSSAPGTSADAGTSAAPGTSQAPGQQPLHLFGRQPDFHFGRRQVLLARLDEQPVHDVADRHHAQPDDK